MPFGLSKNSQGGEILGTATKSYRLRIYGEPSAAHLVPFATRFVPMADAEPAAEQLLTLQCGERTLETLDWQVGVQNIVNVEMCKLDTSIRGAYPAARIALIDRKHLDSVRAH